MNCHLNGIAMKSTVYPFSVAGLDNPYNLTIELDLFMVELQVSDCNWEQASAERRRSRRPRPGPFRPGASRPAEPWLRTQFKNGIQLRKIMHTKKMISHLEWKMNEKASANNTDLVTREDIGIHNDEMTFEPDLPWFCTIPNSSIKWIHSEWPIHARFANSTAQQLFQLWIFWIIQKMFQMLKWVKLAQVTNVKPHKI